MKAFVRQEINLTEHDAELKFATFIKAPIDLRESIEMIPFNFYVNRISMCGKDVFVDLYNNVKSLRLHLIKRGVGSEKIAMSKHPYRRMVQGWYAPKLWIDEFVGGVESTDANME
ncbi:unnamed protein product [Orchesella dallaii]|uniref:Uncharacterized protein n=1 Tax=Orchesella dallaii TaxID=48710 RepID=A0ABP1S0B8_9HEXA